MADAPWRCSQCGTINEPVANACRTCGRWPSLFELEGNTIESDAPTEIESGELYEPEVVETADPEPETYEASEPPDVDEEDSEAAGPPKPRWRGLVRLIVPIAFVIYLVISNVVNR